MARTAIAVSGLHKHYGAHMIFEDAEVAIQEDHRVGVIGRNGAGKSTLVRILLGEESADAGRVQMHADLRLGYIQQHDPFRPDETVVGYLERATGRPAWRCGEVAARFHLGQDLLDRPVAELSGGLQTRIRLAAMLLAEPNFLILDEPTNYLDLKTLLLLERFLLSFRGGWLVVSHDREFLKRTCRETMEVDNGRIHFHPGGIESWLAAKAERRAQAEATNATVMSKRKQLQRFVDRFKAKASKATQAASKAKQLDRLQPIAIEHASAEVQIRIPQVEARNGSALEVDDLVIGYPERTIAREVTFAIDRGAKVAILGDNGQGKTTLLRSLSGSLPTMGGRVKWGANIRIGTYAQHVYKTMDPQLSVRGYLERAHLDTGAAGIPIQEILDLAGSFLFRGDAVNKKIGVLSGGERARLCLAGLLLARYPVLLLDEPTNHLDFETTEALAEALTDYNGTVLFTCHDRTFVAAIASDVLEVRNGTVTRFGDGYDAYVWRLEREAEAEASGGGGPAAPTAAKSAPAADRRDETKAMRRSRLEQLSKARNRLKKLETAIAALDAESKALTAQLADRYEREAGERLQAVTAELGAAEAEWLEVGAEVERLAGDGQ